MFRELRFDIYVVNVDSTQELRLTHNDRSSEPTWAPDGLRIAFRYERDEDTRFSELYMMRPDGTELTRLTKNQFIDVQPAWSPDGDAIAYTAGPKTDNSSDDVQSVDIYVLRADGSKIRLTNHEAYDGNPSWSPDGTQIAFVSARDGNDEIYIMNADGSNQRPLTSRGRNRVPSWSPDGRKIVFVSARDGNDEIYIMNADGSNQRPLTKTRTSEEDPAWSPDGQRIAFSGDAGIFVMTADGMGTIRLTTPDNGSADTSPAWSPDGMRIALARGRL